MHGRCEDHAVKELSTLLSMISLLCLTIGTLDSHPAIFILLGFMLLGFAHGQSGAIVPKRFKPKYAYSASALSTNLSWIFGAAFAPLVGLFLTDRFGLWAASLYLLSGVIVTAIALYLLHIREQLLAEHGLDARSSG